jgi:heme-degrading monooxygenase HmoA
VWGRGASFLVEGFSLRPVSSPRRCINMTAPGVLEVAVLEVLADRAGDFEVAFKMASKIISASPGYLSHELKRCLEVKDKYILLVRWRSLEDHTLGFRGSAAYQDWRQLLHHFYNPFPTVEHYVDIPADSA